MGAFTGLPMDHEEDDFKRPFLEKRYDPFTVFSCGESILKISIEAGASIAFFLNEDNHTLNLADSGRSVSERFSVRLITSYTQMTTNRWIPFGYDKHPELTTTYRCKDVDEELESDKTMVFWLKKIG